MLTNRPVSRRAHLRSHSGRNAGIAFAHFPTAPEFTIPPPPPTTTTTPPPHLFRVMLLERLAFRCPSPVRCARVVGNILILGCATEQRARAQGDTQASHTHREDACEQGLASSSMRMPRRITAPTNRLDHARRDKEAKYPELVASGRCRLVVMAIETGGR